MALTPEDQQRLNDLLIDFNRIQDNRNASAAEHEDMARRVSQLTREEIEYLKQQAEIRNSMIGQLDNILELQRGIGRSIEQQIKDTALYLNQLKEMQGFKEKAALMANAERELGRDLVRQAEEKLRLAKQSGNKDAVQNAIKELDYAKKKTKMLNESADSMTRMDATLNKDLLPGS